MGGEHPDPLPSLRSLAFLPPFEPLPLPALESSQALRVSELLQDLRRWISEGFSYVRVCGELSNLKDHRSGHLYFILKDEKSQLRGVMFRMDRRYLPFTLKEGMEVVIEGEIELYALRGEISLIARRIEPVGTGELLAALRALKERLEREGLFLPERKRPLPFYPRLVGVVTSPQGAAIHDILKVSRRRHPGIDLILSPSRVQGVGAELEVVEGLRRLYPKKPDVIILARGGGSSEDLWTFNTEVVVREVSNSPVPLVSAVGHENDYTLCDFAADARASTPSAAAEMVFPSRKELSDRVSRDRREMVHRIEMILRERRLVLSRLNREIPSPHFLWERTKHRYQFVYSRFHESWRLYWEHLRERLRSQAAVLNALNPLHLLARGYAVVYDESGRVLRSTASVRAGERIIIRLGNGKILGRVEGVEAPTPEGSQ